MFQNEYLQKKATMPREVWTSETTFLDQSPNTHVMPKVNDTFVNGVMDNEKHDTMNFYLLVFIIFSLKIEFFFFIIIILIM